MTGSSIPSIPTRAFADAVHNFWHTRVTQAEQQLLRGVADQGARSAVTGGAQMATFALVIADLAKAVGVKASDIYVTRGVSELPGFYRPTKQWDLLIVAERKLLAAIELKSQVGPSFGNNFNNRTEEAMGQRSTSGRPIARVGFRLPRHPGLATSFCLKTALLQGDPSEPISLIFASYPNLVMPPTRRDMSCSAKN